SGLSRTNELIACFAIGIGMKRLVALLVSVVFMFSCLLLVTQDRFLPALFKKRTTYYWRNMENKPNFFLDLKQDKIWYRSKNLIYNLRSFDPKTREILGMTVYEFDDDFHLLQVVDAEKADYTPGGWKLIKGTVTVFEKENQFPLTKEFATKDLLIAETPKEFQEIEKEVNGLRLKELWKYIQHTKSIGADTKSYEVQFHSRFSLSFIPLVMCVLGIPFSTKTRREGGAAKDLGLCLGITFFYWLFYSLSLSLGTNGALPPWLAAWLPSSIFVAVAAALIARQRR
ncbi:MAG: LptF/LptG family permease, partial [Bdellovibrionota bacterium]